VTAPDPVTVPDPRTALDVPTAPGPRTTVSAGAPAGAATGTAAPAGAGTPPAGRVAPATGTAAPPGGRVAPAAGTAAPAGAGTPRGTAAPGRLAGLHPARRGDLQISGPLRRGPAVVHLVRDPIARRVYELGPKEHFVLAALDGERTLGEIGEEYAGRFRTRLGDAHWSRLLALLGTRRLLAGGPPPVPDPAPTPRSTLLDGRSKLVADAPALVERLHRVTAPLLRPLPLAAAGLAVVAMLVLLAADARALFDATDLLVEHEPVTFFAVGVLLWLSLAGHELAHGVVARACGGTVGEIGLRWRLPLVYPYCTVEDVQLLPQRRRQIAVAVAGVAANLLFLLPFAVAWLVLPEHAQARPAVAGMLLIGLAVALANLIPLPPLDGYKMLGYALRVDRLAAGSRGFLALLALRLAGRGPGVAAYPARLRRVYGGYGAFVLLAAAGLVAGVVALAAARWGPAAGLVPVAVLAALLVLWCIGLLARRRRSAEVVA
jgi:putative peptide zinc metalloprotease protein